MMGADWYEPRSGFSYHFAQNHFAWSLLSIPLSPFPCHCPNPLSSGFLAFRQKRRSCGVCVRRTANHTSAHRSIPHNTVMSRTIFHAATYSPYLTHGPIDTTASSEGTHGFRLSVSSARFARPSHFLPESTREQGEELQPRMSRMARIKLDDRRRMTDDGNRSCCTLLGSWQDR